MKINELLDGVVLENDSIILRHFVTEDKSSLYSFLSDTDSCYLDGGYEPVKEYDEKYTAFFEDIFLGDNTRFCIIDKTCGTPVGFLHLMEDKSRTCSTIELGFGIIPQARGRGYASSCVNLISEHLFKETKVELIILGTMEINKGCRRLAEKCGFIYEGRKHKAGWDAWNRCSCDLLYFYKEP